MPGEKRCINQGEKVRSWQGIRITIKGDYKLPSHEETGSHKTFLFEFKGETVLHPFNKGEHENQGESGPFGLSREKERSRRRAQQGAEGGL